MTHKRIGVLVATLAAATMVLSACGSKPAPAPATSTTPAPAAATPAPAKPAQVVVAIKGDPSGLDPQVNDDGNMQIATENIYESLVGRDGQTLELKPLLATSWTQVDPTTTEFKLRQGVKFQNGDPLTVDDVVWSVKRQIDPNTKSAIADTFATIKDAVKVDDSTVRVLTKGTDPSILNRMAWLKILDSKFFTGKDEAFVQTNTMGTGPYALVTWEKGKQLTMKANASYWGGAPKVATVVVRPVESDATRLAGLQSGEIDIATEMQPRSINDIPVAKPTAGLEYSLILINRFNSIFKDPKLAQAAVMAVDNQSLAKNLFQGMADPSGLLPFKPTSVGFSTKGAPLAYNPDKAKQLLKDAGYNGQQVQLVGENGRFLKDGETAQAVGQMLQAVGFNVQVKMVTFDEWLKELFTRDKSPDLIYLSHSNDIFDADRTYSTYVLSKGSGSKYTTALDDKVNAARTEADPAKRQAIYDDIAQTLANDPAWIPLVNTKNIYGMTKRVTWNPRLDQKILFSEVSVNQ